MPLPEQPARRTRRSVAGRSPCVPRPPPKICPGASFAGQQDTYLNVVGDDALLEAIRSLLGLAVERARRGIPTAPTAIDDASVQPGRGRPADGAGGCRGGASSPPTRSAVGVAVPSIDAIAELGEELVSGAVNPDHYVVDIATPCASWSDSRAARAVRAVGRRAAGAGGRCADASNATSACRRTSSSPSTPPQPWLVQSRPITTLYPLPAMRPNPELRPARLLLGQCVPGLLRATHADGHPVLPAPRHHPSTAASARDRPTRSPATRTSSRPAMRLFVDVTPVAARSLRRALFAVDHQASAKRAAQWSLGASQSIRDWRSTSDRASRTLRRILAALHARWHSAGRAAGVALAHCARARFVREIGVHYRVNLPLGRGRARAPGRVRTPVARRDSPGAAATARHHRAGHAVARSGCSCCCAASRASPTRYRRSRAARPTTRPPRWTSRCGRSAWRCAATRSRGRR